ncbi:MAG TPA: UDP-N-acetylglucosamine 1-carboxyvinyltransferase [Ignavibacteriaceae bacterium]|nr:UDP-N-acetylglucosamine 1-carboxyvinyltransferase [Ignavibacteriaceae bacterium]
MDKFIITGGKKLEGRVRVSGAKNASLALMPATLLASGVSKLNFTPALNDVYTMIKLLNQLGVETNFNDDFLLTLDTKNITSQTAPYEHVKKMRASVYVLGPLLAKYGFAKVSLPGGCAWGPRPINLHIEGLKKLGAEIELEQGYIIAKSDRLHGAKINFDKPSVGATGNILMAACLAKGTTVINNAAMEPEITNLVQLLINMGAKINGINTSILEIEGVDTLQPAEVNTIPDRIEAGTLLVAAAITKGKITIEGGIDSHLYSVLSKLEDTNAKIFISENEITIDAADIDIQSVDVTTGVFPGYPTDMQAQWIAYMSAAKGVSTVTDTVYLDRFSHVSELTRLGAEITVQDNSAIIKGVPKLKGAKVMSTDLRASASLVLAGLAAEGTTEVLRVYHLDRGYEKLENKLKQLGAEIERVSTSEF